jgi:hypothetical protein
MARKGHHCRCCCQFHSVVEVPLVRKADHYSQQAINGKGPYRLDGVWLTISEVVAGALRASTAGGYLRLRTVAPASVRLPTHWHPVTTQANGAAANFGVVPLNGNPAYTTGDTSLSLSGSSKAFLVCTLVTVGLPPECAAPEYWDISSIQPFPGGRYMRDAGLLISFNDFQDSEMEGIENYWSPVDDFGQLRTGLVERSPRRLPVIADLDKGVAVDDGYTTLSNPYYPWPEETPLPLTRYATHRKLACGDQERWVVVPPYNAYREDGGPFNVAQLDLKVCSQATSGANLFTASVFRGDPGFGLSTTGDISVQHSPQRNPLAISGYTNVAPLSVGGQDVSIFRNGSLELEAVRPTQSQLQGAMAEDGAYLIVSDVSEASDPEGLTRPHAPRLLRQYGSVVVDSTPPLVGFVPLNDAYADEFSGLPRITHTGMFASEPIFRLGLNAAERFVLANNQPTPQEWTPGEYTLVAFESARVHDRAGNHPAAAGMQPLVLRQTPANPYRRGAEAVFKLPHECKIEQPHVGGDGSYTANGNYSRRSPLPYVDLAIVSLTRFPGGEVFVRPSSYVMADGESVVAPGQFTLLRNGQSVSESVTVDRINSQLFRVWLPVAAQQPGGLMRLTWTPGAESLAEKRLKLFYDTVDDFPPGTEALPNRLYVSRETGVVYELEWPSQEYVEYQAEPCVLATRTAWLVLPETAAPNLIDVSSVDSTIGRHVSVSQPVSGAAGPAEIQTSGGLFLPVSGLYGSESLSSDERFTGLGTFSDAEAEGFVPRVPPPSPSTAHPRCSYFGLSTTIDPCPPGTVSPCAGPLAGQPHSSVIRSAEEITDFEIELVRYENDEPATEPLLAGPDSPNLNWPMPQEQESYFDFDAMRALMSLAGPYSFSSEIRGTDASQNTWFCESGPVEEKIDIKPSYSQGHTGDDPVDDSTHVLSFGQFVGLKSNVRYGSLGSGETFFMDSFLGRPDVSLGVVPARQMSGVIRQDGMQAVATAYRRARTYSGLKTTTLSELAISLSFRMVVAVETTFEDRSLELPEINMQNMQPNVAPNPPGQDDISPGNFWRYGGWFPNPGVTPPFSGSSLGTFQATLFMNNVPWTDLAVDAEKTLVRRCFIGLNDTLFFSDEQEQALANGDTVTIPHAVFGQDYRWKIRKGSAT